MSGKREVQCSYGREWLPLRGGRKTCPRCGARLDAVSTHPTREANDANDTNKRTTKRIRV
ncbi:MAG: hypothetical protein V7638_3877 [Acidobacteriota bacterium]|jgi:hypothetical protein